MSAGVQPNPGQPEIVLHCAGRSGWHGPHVWRWRSTAIPPDLTGETSPYRRCPGSDATCDFELCPTCWGAPSNGHDGLNNAQRLAQFRPAAVVPASTEADEPHPKADDLLGIFTLPPGKTSADLLAEARGTEADDRAAQIAARAGKATAGPWKVWAMEVLADPVGDSNLDTALPIARTTDPHRGLRTFNADFIAAARQDVPWLLSELAAAHRERDEAKAQAERHLTTIRSTARLIDTPGGYAYDELPRIVGGELDKWRGDLTCGSCEKPTNNPDAFCDACTIEELEERNDALRAERDEVLARLVKVRELAQQAVWDSAHQAVPNLRTRFARLVLAAAGGDVK